MMLLHVDHRLAVGQTARIPKTIVASLGPSGLRVGHILTTSDREGRDFRVRIISMDSQHCDVFVFEAFGAPVESPLAIHLLQALPKKEKFEWIIQKVTELGVYSIVPLECEKSITLDQRDARQKKSHRWQGIATKAAEQCRRPRIPQVYPTLGFSHALEMFETSDLRRLLSERVTPRDLRLSLAAGEKRPASAALVVGPEGGFSSREFEMAYHRGYTPIHLGQRILRTETAAITATAILQYALGDLSGRDQS